MFNPFEHNEANLGRAGWCLLIAVLGGVALAIALEQLGLAGELAMIFVLMVNLVASWFLARAAQASGKSPLLYGLLSALGPPAAIFLFFSLVDRDESFSSVRNNKLEEECLISLMREHGVGESASGMAAWTAFKTYGEEVFGQQGVGLLFQAGTHEFSGSPRFYFNPVCQFEITAANGEHDHFEQLLCELTCPPDEELSGIDIALWSFDYPSATDFFAAVEASHEFQVAAKRSDYRVSIRYEDV
jgi:hypothetical protein